LHGLRFKTEDVAEEVTVAAAGVLVLTNKQMDGYAYFSAR
jgi:intracellular sulfur oxidation DsrE/DsrF family protein